MRDNYDALKTEGRNPNTMNIDKVSTLEAMRLMNEENKRVPEAIDTQLEEIAKAVDLIAAAMERGGHLIYVGAGTSGRLGIIAGGDGAMFRAVENAEDNEEWGKRAIDEDGVQPGDVVVGISAAGRAPFVLGALKRAREIGATPIGVTCNPDSLFVPLCDVTIAPYVGPEVISGSTRLKAGTAQKLVLNMLSTGAMIRTGKVYSNLMINVKPTNEKLWERATRIIMQIADIDHDRAGELLRKHGSIRGALSELGLM